MLPLRELEASLSRRRLVHNWTVEDNVPESLLLFRKKNLSEASEPALKASVPESLFCIEKNFSNAVKSPTVLGKVPERFIEDT